MADQLPQNLLAQSPFIDPEQQQALTELQRKQQLANLLMQRGMQTPQGQMVSGRYVKPNPLEYLANLANVYVGQNLQEKASKEQANLAQALREQKAKGLQEFMASAEARPEETIYGAGKEGPTMQYQPARPAVPYGQRVATLAQTNPELGNMLMADLLKTHKIGEGETLQRGTLAGGFEPVAKGAEKLPTEYKEYQKAVEGGFKGSFFDYQQALKRAGAPSVSVNTAKDISAQVGDIAKESRIQAAGAVQTADAANRIIQAVDSKNLISGPGANVRLQAAQIADAIGAGGNTTADKIANSRQAVQGLAQLTLQGRKQMRGEGSITESEGKLAERAMSGDLNFTAAEIRQLAEAAKRSAKFTYNQHQNIINTMQNNPEAKGLVPYFQVPADADIFNPRPVGGQSATRTKADQILQGKP
jgi:hypothetical protein